MVECKICIHYEILKQGFGSWCNRYNVWLTEYFRTNVENNECCITTEQARIEDKSW